MRFLDRLMPDRLLLLWLAVGGVVAFAFSIGGAAALGFEASAIENGPQENLEIALLLVAALGFLATALFRQMPGAPVMAFLALVFGLMGLREFETPIDNDILAYLAGHAARIHWAVLVLATGVFVAFRDRRWSLGRHLRATDAVWFPLIGAALIVLLGSVAESAAGKAPEGTHIHDLMEWLEESLEVCAYGVAAIMAAWMWRQGKDQTPNPADGITFEPESR